MMIGFENSPNLITGSFTRGTRMFFFQDYSKFLSGFGNICTQIHPSLFD